MVLVMNVSGRLTELPNGGLIDVEDEYAGVRFSTNPSVRRRKRMLKNKEILWPKAAVIYKVEDLMWESFNHDYLKVFEAMEDIMRETCVRFKEWSGEPDFVFVEYNLGLRSSNAAVGRKIGQSWLRIGQQNFVKEVILHELGHTLGLRHEHQRPDRDHYVDVLWQNIEREQRAQFEQLDKSSVNLFGEPFDFDSIMMYHDCSSSDPARPAKLQSKTGRNLKLKAGVGNLNTKLSASDVKRIQDLYRCDGAFQKPSFPVDIVCSFDKDNCNFKNLRSRKNQKIWEWKPLSLFQQPPEGNLIWSINCNRKTTIKESVWSVGFYGRSLLANNRDLQGCVRLKYMFQTHGRGVHTLKVSNQMFLPLNKIVLENRDLNSRS
ncbi:astacin-like metalloprotease toxin 3 [Bemisia tabaci]